MAISLSSRHRALPATTCPPAARDGTKAADVLPALLLLVAGLAGLVAAWLVTAPNSGRWLVVGRPGLSQGQTINLIRTARGQLIGGGGLANVALARSDRTDFAASARRAGAWLAVRIPLGAECETPSSHPETAW